jgi:hypothetical protein
MGENRAPGSMVGVLFVVIDMEHKGGVFCPHRFVNKFHSDALALVHLNQMRKLRDPAAGINSRECQSTRGVSDDAAQRVLVALKKDPLEAFKKPKLVVVREILSTPAAQVQEHLAALLQMEIQRLKL